MCCELWLLYYILCAVLYSINVVQELFKSSIVCHILCNYIVCIMYHAFFVLHYMSFVYCGCKSCIVFLSPVCHVYIVSPLLPAQCAMCVIGLYCISTTASVV